MVLGRSNIVGKPVAQLLLQADCTVTIAHSRTREPADECRAADILIAAIGKPEFVQGDWIKPGAVVIDVGINRVDDPANPGKTKLVGDVAFAEASKRAARHHPGARRRRPDDHRLPSQKHAGSGASSLAKASPPRRRGPFSIQKMDARLRGHDAYDIDFT